MLSIQPSQENICICCPLSPIFPWSGEIQGESGLSHVIQPKLQWGECIISADWRWTRHVADKAAVPDKPRSCPSEIIIWRFYALIFYFRIVMCLSMEINLVYFYESNARARALTCSCCSFMFVLFLFCLSTWENSRRREAADRFCCHFILLILNAASVWWSSHCQNMMQPLSLSSCWSMLWYFIIILWYLENGIGIPDLFNLQLTDTCVNTTSYCSFIAGVHISRCFPTWKLG